MDLYVPEEIVEQNWVNLVRSDETEYDEQEGFERGFGPSASYDDGELAEEHRNIFLICISVSKKKPKPNAS